MKSKQLAVVAVIIMLVTALVMSQSTNTNYLKQSVIISKHQKKIEQIIVKNQSKIPILMYHAFSETNSELCVSPKDFALQMQWLADNNYSPITLKQLYEHWNNKSPIPSKPIVLTFDDGYLDNYTVAYQEMKKHGFVGVLFIYADKFNRGNNVTIEQVKEMYDYGWEIGNHSYYHRELTRVDDTALITETKTAKTKLVELTGAEITSFCYPAGKYNDKVIEAVKNSEHIIAVTTNYGYSKLDQGILSLSRVRINRSDKLKGYIRKLS